MKTKLFQLFLYDEENPVKTYAEIEMFVFHTITNNTKKIRNLMTRLRVKLVVIYSIHYMDMGIL